MIAGAPSHGPGLHEYNAGILLFAKSLGQGSGTKLEVKTHLSGEWPAPAELARADTILMFSDGGEKHPALEGDHLAQLATQMKRGCGFICLHFALEVPAGKGGPEFREWLGGYFEVGWSINPRWPANIQDLPKHPIANGLKPFTVDDELYYHMRFKEGMAGVTPILSAVAPEKSVRSDSPRGGNPAVRAEVAARKPQPIAWAVERPDGGRGFGFTAGHTHRGWADDHQRKTLLNAILWTAKVEVPPNGVESTVTAADMAANLDPKGRATATATPLPPLPTPTMATAPLPVNPSSSFARFPDVLARSLIAAISMDSPANGSVVFSRAPIAARFAETVEFGTDNGRQSASFAGKKAVLTFDPPLQLSSTYTLATWMTLPTPGNPGNVWQSMDDCALLVIDDAFAAWQKAPGARSGKREYYPRSPALAGWHHVAVTCDGKRLLFYLDGERKGEQPITVEPLIKSVGNHYNPDRQTKNCGRLDDMFVFNRELSETEIAQLMRLRAEGIPASLPNELARGLPATSTQDSAFQSAPSTGLPKIVAATSESMEHIGRLVDRGGSPRKLQKSETATTKATFQPPVEILIEAKTDSTNLRLSYAADAVIFNWDKNRTELRVDGGPAGGKHKPGAGLVPTNRYVAIRWIVTPKKQTIYVDDQLRFEHAGDYSRVDAPVSVYPSNGSEVTVKTIKVKQLPPGTE